MHQLPFPGPYHAVGAVFIQNHHRFPFQVFPFQSPAEASAGQAGRKFLLHPQQIHERREKVILAVHACNHLPLGQRRGPGNEEGHLYGGIIHVEGEGSVSFSPDPMMPHIHSIVRHKEYKGIFQLPFFPQEIKNSPHAMIHGSNCGIVASQQFLPVFPRPHGSRRYLPGMGFFFGNGVKWTAAVAFYILRGMLLLFPWAVRSGIVHAQIIGRSLRG